MHGGAAATAGDAAISVPQDSIPYACKVIQEELQFLTRLLHRNACQHHGAKYFHLGREVEKIFQLLQPSKLPTLADSAIAMMRGHGIESKKSSRAKEAWIDEALVYARKLQISQDCCVRALRVIIRASKHFTEQISETYFMALSAVFLACLARLYTCTLRLADALGEILNMVLRSIEWLPLAASYVPIEMLRALETAPSVRRMLQTLLAVKDTRKISDDVPNSARSVTAQVAVSSTVGLKKEPMDSIPKGGGYNDEFEVDIGVQIGRSSSSLAGVEEQEQAGGGGGGGGGGVPSQRHILVESASDSGEDEKEKEDDDSNSGGGDGSVDDGGIARSKEGNPSIAPDRASPAVKRDDDSMEVCDWVGDAFGASQRTINAGERQLASVDNDDKFDIMDDMKLNRREEGKKAKKGNKDKERNKGKKIPSEQISGTDSRAIERGKKRKFPGSLDTLTFASPIVSGAAGSNTVKPSLVAKKKRVKSGVDAKRGEGKQEKKKKKKRKAKAEHSEIDDLFKGIL